MTGHPQHQPVSPGPPPWVTGPPWWVLLGCRVLIVGTVIMSDPIRAARICRNAARVGRPTP